MGLSPSRFLTVSVLLTLFFSVAAPPAASAADEKEPSGPALTSYTQATGKNGSTLKWTPYRTPSGGAVNATSTAQRVVRNASPAPVRVATRSANSVMSNPFGDAPQTLAQAAPPSELEEMPAAEPKPTVAEPKTPAEEPAKLAEPKVEPVVPKTVKEPVKVQPQPQAEEDAVVLPCPKPTDKYAPGESKFFKSIGELTTNINVPDDLRVREGMKQVLLEDHECKLDFHDPRSLDPTARQRWTPITFTWKASGLYHKPLYFEDIQLERYGHSCGPFLQPLASGAHFFLTVPMLPYKMGLEPPDECMYTLGYYRPGSCAPYMLDPIPLSARAALAEAGVVTGLIFIIP